MQRPAKAPTRELTAARRFRLARLCALPLLALPAIVVPAAVQAQGQTVTMVNREGDTIGTVELTALSAGLLLRVDVSGLPADARLGFHVHEAADCDPTEGFEGAGGHFDPSGVEHGYLTETGPHAGDLPNLQTDGEGVARADVFTPFLRFGPGAASIHGRALMIHSEPDDYESQPSGGAGDRLACAELP
ncbi:superoxide dismutase family protein [Pararhodobacter sp.]|uniref:superoxide dismutase family protein n=1 Tax=Pararhodobacter sp. TaxID=2127056 RepID=UPI002FDF5A4C